LLPTFQLIKPQHQHHHDVNESVVQRLRAYSQERTFASNISDSIKYAKFIQEARLPRKDEFASIFPESFVLYKPKDIVSGDFYFVHKNDNHCFISAADCTGHGVPGAFMSLIGSEKLEDAVSKHTEPASILQFLNKSIKSSLRQNENGHFSKDGMDIAFCAVDTQSRTVRFAGANRPLWIIRKNSNEVEQYNPTRKSIGGITKDDQNFECQDIIMNPGDTMYLFSDGYADTFGGEKNSKLTTRRFKNFLLDINHLPIHEHEQKLDDFINNWKNNIEQIDDILVLGVRF
jgi:serine phosphatase RsbU (regulator of sigma subunit)